MANKDFVLTPAMAHVVSTSIADYYEASDEHRLAYADRMAGAISAVLYIAQADQDVEEAEQPQGGGGTETAPQHKEGGA